MDYWFPATVTLIGIAIVWLSVAYALLGTALRAVGFI
jgi:hypothetical protein